MFDRLIPSSNHLADRPRARSGTVAVLLHAGVCAAAVLATLRTHRVSRGESLSVVISWPHASEDRSLRDRFDGIPGPPEPSWGVPPQPPIGLPPIDDRPPFDPRLLLRGGGGDPRVDGVPEGPWSPTAVDNPPALLAGPPLVYPDVLRRAGTQGTVVVQAVIDTLGRAEPGSLALESSHAGFEAAARAYVLGVVFRPGRAHGRAVRVLVRLPIGFTLAPPR
jgi:TonB family protein